MATIKSQVQTTSTLTVTGLSTLTSAAYVVSNTITHITNEPLDVLVDVSVTVGTVSSNKQVIIFAKQSIDGVNFSSGPESGTTTTDEPDLYWIGSIPTNANSTAYRRVFSLANAYGGILPHSSKLVIKNETGAALTAGSVQIAEVWGVLE